MQLRRARNIEYCGGAAVSREAPACLRVRITGNVSSDIDEIDGREKLAWRCFAQSKEDAAASTKEEEEAVKVPGSIPRTAGETALYSLAVRSRSRDLKYLLKREHELVAINYCSTDDSRGQGSKPAEYRGGARKEEDV